MITIQNGLNQSNAKEKTSAWKSLEAPSRAHWWANWVLVCGLVIGLGSTGLINWAGNIKENSLKRDVPVANADAVQAIERAATAELRAAEVNFELERIKAPRRLRAEQRTRITEQLKPFRGLTFGIVTHPWEEEPATFKSILLETLDGAGWAVDIHHGRDSLRTRASGVVVLVTESPSTRVHHAAQALVESLTFEGFAARIDYEKVKPRSIEIEIQIGPKH